MCVQYMHAYVCAHVYLGPNYSLNAKLVKPDIDISVKSIIYF